MSFSQRSCWDLQDLCLRGSPSVGCAITGLGHLSENGSDLQAWCMSKSAVKGQGCDANVSVQCVNLIFDQSSSFFKLQVSDSLEIPRPCTLRAGADCCPVDFLRLVGQQKVGSGNNICEEFLPKLLLLVLICAIWGRNIATWYFF